ncbi:MAG: hypothetical protein AAF587_23505 [Bacteroidota bacterium]
MKKSIIPFAILFILLQACEQDIPEPELPQEEPEPEVIRGCMDPTAVNYNIKTLVSNDSCTYTKIRFYSLYLGVYDSTGRLDRFERSDIYIDDEYIGYTDAIYQMGPQNASCIHGRGLLYEFQDGNKVEWRSMIHLESGDSLLGPSGVLTPSHKNECGFVEAGP